MRKPRQIIPGARYHVTARTNRKVPELGFCQIKLMLEEVISRAKRKYSFRVLNFCIMDNHVHLIIEPIKGESLSAIMKWILCVFAMAYNRRMGVSGHFWGDRFYSRPIESREELRRVFGYIDDNPVKAKCVKYACHWRFGGLWHDRHGFCHIQDEIPRWLLAFFPLHISPQTHA